MVGNACVGHGGSKDVSLCLQVLCHEAAIGGTHTADLGGIDEGMLLANLLRPLDDVLGRTTASGVHVARCPLLAKAGGTTGL